MKGNKIQKINPELDKNNYEDYDNNQGDSEDLVNGPVEQRSCTDIICILLLIISNILLLYIASEGWNNGNPEKLLAVYDKSNKACGIDLPDYPYLYFPVPHKDWLNQTTCVAECPQNSTLEKLDCNINPEIPNCNKKCSPLDLTSTKGWEVSLNPDLSDIFCIYETEVFLDRVCFPGTGIMEMVPGLTEELNKYVDTEQLSGWFNDVKLAWPVIIGSIGVVFWLGVAYMIFVRIFSGIIVWVCILGYFVCLALLQIFCYIKYNEIKTNREECNCEIDPNTQENQDTYMYVGIALSITFLICLVLLFCMWNSIKLAIAIIQTATNYVTDTPQAMFIPPIFAILTALLWIFWIGAAAYVYSVGEFSVGTTNIFATVTHTEDQKLKIWYFIFAGLWNNAFIQAICQFILCSAPCIWYFAQGPNSEAHNPVFRSVWRAFRYHLGSLAFGALILAIVQIIRLILEYVYKQSEQAGAGNNKVMKFFMNCLRCYMKYFEEFIRFLNRNAYIQIALSGRNFCGAAREAMRIIWANPARMTLINGLGGMFIFIGKMFMVMACTFIAYEILIYVDPFKSQLTSVVLPCFIVFIISYGISIIFMSVYGMGIDAIMMCFLYDEEQTKGSIEGPKHCPENLKVFINAVTKKQKK